LDFCLSSPLQLSKFRWLNFDANASIFSSHFFSYKLDMLLWGGLENKQDIVPLLDELNSSFRFYGANCCDVNHNVAMISISWGGNRVVRVISLSFFTEDLWVHRIETVLTLLIFFFIQWNSTKLIWGVIVDKCSESCSSHLWNKENNIYFRETLGRFTLKAPAKFLGYV
jgi:hypothetical protein